MLGGDSVLMEGVTYLCDPLEWFSAQLYAIESKEPDGSLRWNSDHEELVVECDLHVANVGVHEGLAILAVVNLPGVLLVVNVDVQFAIGESHQARLVVLDVVQSGQLCDGHVDLASLERVAVLLTIVYTIAEDVAH